MPNVAGPLAGVRRALVVHENGARVALVTCSRGEAGEIVAGVLPSDTSEAELAAVREREVRGSVAALGIDAHYWLGTPPARGAGADARAYRDSGMRWVRPGVAGPADTTDDRSLTAAPLAEVVADLAAALALEAPDLIISYDDAGGYGHPDHVRAREAALACAREAGVPFAELIEQPDVPGTTWYQLSRHRHAVLAALRSHRTQLTVAVDGESLVHSGGQRQAVTTDIGLRLVD
jgi:N-acetyl-1-D-myo-inositol-2-amino-2-deoxy-alpha-D-glucopyranoside deacetylase